jgi:lysylphosphatidylglycerol synthetase-like protein (DUF2156 family)
MITATLYSFKGLEFQKERYRGQPKPVYVASTNRRTLPLLRDMLVTIKTLRVI